jgi:hypothetical protein
VSVSIHFRITPPSVAGRDGRRWPCFALQPGVREAVEQAYTRPGTRPQLRHGAAHSEDAAGVAAPFQPAAGGYTVLRCAKRGAFATKMWSWNPTLNQWIKRTYSAGMWFRPTEENANSLDEVAAAIIRICRAHRHDVNAG